MTQALRESHQDEKRFPEEAIARLKRDHERIQARIDAMQPFDSLRLRLRPIE